MDAYLYKEEIIDHYKHPQNFGELKASSVHARQLNPFCGDEIELFLKIEKGSIVDVSFQGHGCAISIAGASMLTEKIKNKTLKELGTFTKDDMLSILGVTVSETRKKCALLAWSVLKDCLSKKP